MASTIAANACSSAAATGVAGRDGHTWWSGFSEAAASGQIDTILTDRPVQDAISADVALLVFRLAIQGYPYAEILRMIRRRFRGSLHRYSPRYTGNPWARLTSLRTLTIPRHPTMTAFEQDIP